MAYTQTFYGRGSNEAHQVSIQLRGTTPSSRGDYAVIVDGEVTAREKFKASAYDKVVDIIKDHNWSSIRRA